MNFGTEFLLESWAMPKKQFSGSAVADHFLLLLSTATPHYVASQNVEFQVRRMIKCNTTTKPKVLADSCLSQMPAMP